MEGMLLPHPHIPPAPEKLAGYTRQALFLACTAQNGALRLLQEQGFKLADARLRCMALHVSQPLSARCKVTSACMSLMLKLHETRTILWCADASELRYWLHDGQPMLPRQQLHPSHSLVVIESMTFTTPIQSFAAADDFATCSINMPSMQQHPDECGMTDLC